MGARPRTQILAPLCMQDFYYSPSSKPWLQKKEIRHETQKARREEEEEEEIKEEKAAVKQIHECSKGFPILGIFTDGCSSLPSLHDITFILNKCRKERDQEHALRIYTFLCKGGLDIHKELGNHLVSILLDIGNFQEAQQVSNRLLFSNEPGGHSLVMGHLECASPSVHTFVALLKACAKTKDLGRGIKIHDDVARLGLLKVDLFVGCTLVDMYMKCGSIAKAKKLFNELPNRNVVLWNALIAGYVENEHNEEALDCYKQMRVQGFIPDAVTFVSMLKAFASTKNVDKGVEVHVEIERRGFLERNVFVGSSLVDMYVKCGLLAKAHQVFDKLLVRDVVSWTALIWGHTEHGPGEEALECFERMLLDSVSPNGATFVCILKACANIGAINKGRDIHSEIERKRLLDKNIVVGSTLVHMYAKCGVLTQARQVFDKLPIRNVVSWTSLIAGYVEHDNGEEALECFGQMQLQGVSPNASTFVCILKACAMTGAIDKGQDLHTLIERKGFLEGNLFIGNTLVDMYAKFGVLTKAQQVFDKLKVRDLISWNTLITGYVKHGQPENALKCYERMQLEGVSPNAVTFICSLRACAMVRAFDKGQQIHNEIEKREGLLENDVVVASTLVDMYIKCGMLTKARQVFDKLPVCDTVLWTTLIAGYVDHGHGEDALKCYEVMQSRGVFLDAVTLLCSLKACGSIKAIDKALEIHSEIERKGLLERDLAIGSTLVDMYAKCGFLAKAQQVFDKLPARDVVAWTALISGYVEHDYAEEALDFFEQMRLQGISPNAVTFTCGLKACGSLGAIVKGQLIHAEIQRKGILERDLGVGSTLVDMYAKCGSLAIAQQVFDKLPVRDVVSWNALISGYSQLGTHKLFFHAFERMVEEGIKPDSVTLLVVLHGCSRVGLFNQSQSYFESISRDYGIVPTIEHHNIMVDLLSRAGQLDKAITMIQRTPFCPTVIMWRAVLGACKNWGNKDLAKQAFTQAVHMDASNSAAYVLMSHAYAGEVKQANGVERARVDNAIMVSPS